MKSQLTLEMALATAKWTRKESSMIPSLYDWQILPDDTISFYIVSPSLRPRVKHFIPFYRHGSTTSLLPIIPTSPGNFILQTAGKCLLVTSQDFQNTWWDLKLSLTERCTPKFSTSLPPSCQLLPRQMASLGSHCCSHHLSCQTWELHRSPAGIRCWGHPGEFNKLPLSCPL